jgi:hypothetical protein
VTAVTLPIGIVSALTVANGAMGETCGHSNRWIRWRADMIWQIDFPSAWPAVLRLDHAVLRLDKVWTDRNLLVCSAIAGVFLLIAVVGAGALPAEPVGICLILALLSALAGVDKALRTFPMHKVALAPGMALGFLAMLMLFHH